VIALGTSGQKTPTRPATAASGRANPTTTALSALQQWGRRNLGIISTLGVDLQSIGTDATAASQSGDYSTIAADCATLGRDVASAQALPPIPDPSAEGQWTAALSDLASASQDCTQGIAQGDVGLMDQVSTEINTANGELTALAASIGS
jgi:hypothetical protein